MPLQRIIVVFLRLFALECFVGAIVALPQWAFRGINNVASAISVIATILASIFLWFLAEPLARFASRKHNPFISFGSLTRQDIYCFAFVFVGLSCFVYGLFGLVSICGLAFGNKVAAIKLPHAEMQMSFNNIPRDAVKSLLGLFIVLFANNWSKQLIARENRPTN